jgi:hypothetical protein
MRFSMTPLLMHSEAVPRRARDALKAAWGEPPERREAALESAARVLYRETELDCGETRDLIGLAPTGCCG